ncbi:hypothetical protein [uncultured Nocardioides sp.]|uniref:hypothetical protein n=1 Tax=uncultured Nocardioides sp. TaxID=198441 RepID=UPI002629DF56|nr:hypothetical protein [uncultured Nocardioides sp.]
MTKWGVYNLQGRSGDGRTVAASDRAATRWFVRWRVDTVLHKRTLRQKGHAKTFHDNLLRAKLNDWQADDRGWPINPAIPPAQIGEADVDIRNVSKLRALPTENDRGPSFAAYCELVWWPLIAETLNDKNMLGHRRNMRLAMDLLVYPDGDNRCTAAKPPGAPILLRDLTADDLRRAVSARRKVNARTAAVNERRLESAFAQGQTDLALDAEVASPATVRAFYITVSMIVSAARRSGYTTGDPLQGVGRYAPPPRPQRVSDRVLPSLPEIRDLAEAIATLGPTIDGHPAGARFRALVLAAGTLGARPGELVAHRPELIAFGSADRPTLVTFEQTEAAVYDTETNLQGRRLRSLKHRLPGERRVIPAFPETAEALRAHLESGFALESRTFSSASGRARLDWGNIRSAFWRPACEKVFAGGPKAALVNMPPKTLRKAAITIWLDAGVKIHDAADWAGHSTKIAELHYVGRTSHGFEHDYALLTSYERGNA